MSPGKCPSPNTALARHRSPSPAAARLLNFTSAKPVFSWADRVRGVSRDLSSELDMKAAPDSVLFGPTIDVKVSNKTGKPSPVIESSTEGQTPEDDEGGWEIVTKGRTKSKLSSQGSASSLTSGMSKMKSEVDHGNTDSFSNDTSSANKPMTRTTPGNKERSKLTDSAKDLVESVVTSSESYTSSSMLPSSNNCLNDVVVDSFSDIALPIETSNASSRKSSICSYIIPDGPATPSNDGRMSPEPKSFQSDMDVFIKDQSDMDETISIDGDSYTMPHEMSDDDLSNRINEEQEKALLSAIEEEQTLTKELEDEALKDDHDDQDDDLSSDKELLHTGDGRDTPKDVSEDILDSSLSLDAEPSKVMTWDEIVAQYDNQANKERDWADESEEFSGRAPGKMIEMHQKFSSPSRKKSRTESVKLSEEKMARVERKRLRLLEEKCQRLKSLSERVRHVREYKNSLIEDTERHININMRKAEENRKIQLQEKVKKAQEEEAKVNEIAFINSLEAQNKKIEVQEKHQVSEARLQDLLEERQRRREDKQAKEEAAQERRRALEQERLARLQEIKQKRGDQAAKWEKDRVEREKIREEAARERQKEREQKLSARNEALQQAAEELQRKIDQKQLESTRRHEQRIEQVKERAASSSRHGTVEDTPSSVPYENAKKCTLCGVQILSDVYLHGHLKGKKHRDAVKEINKKITDAEMDAFSSKYIKDSEGQDEDKLKEKEDRIKSLKKRAKKIKARMAVKGKEYEATMSSNTKMVESTRKAKLQKAMKDMNKLLQSHASGTWPESKIAQLDKALSETTRALREQSVNDQRVFCQIGGLAVVSRVLLLADNGFDKTQKQNSLPPK